MNRLHQLLVLIALAAMVPGGCARHGTQRAKVDASRFLPKAVMTGTNGSYWTYRTNVFVWTGTNADGCRTGSNIVRQIYVVSCPPIPVSNVVVTADRPCSGTLQRAESLSQSTVQSPQSDWQPAGVFAGTNVYQTTNAVGLFRLAVETTSVTVAWNADPKAWGYWLYYKADGTNGTNGTYVDCGSNTTGTVTGLVPGRQYVFAATSHTVLESEKSDWLAAVAPAPCLKITTK